MDSSSANGAVGGRVSILLLEDQALVRASMRALIQFCQPRAAIKEAGSDDEALHTLSALPIDIAFLDLDLKETRSGIDVLKYIRASELTTRAIILSARSEEFHCARMHSPWGLWLHTEGYG